MIDQLDIIIQKEVAYIFDTLDVMTCEDANTFSRKGAFCVPYAQAINRAEDDNIKNGHTSSRTYQRPQVYWELHRTA